MARTASLEGVVEHRGSAASPFGFIYFGGVRVLFHRGMLANGNWGWVRGKQFAQAWRLLHAEGVSGYENPDTARLRDVDAESGAVSIGLDQLAKIGYPYK